RRVVAVLDFRNPDSGFPNGRAPSGVAEHRYDTAAGEYVITMLRAADAGSDASVWDAVLNIYVIYDDFQLDVEARQDGQAANGAWGVIFRAQDFANYYKLSLDPNSGQFEFYKLLNDR